MRDIKAGRDINVEGGLTIYDHSQQIGKLLVHCTNDELRGERIHRKNLLHGERKRKLSYAVLFWFICAAVLVALAIYTYGTSNFNLSSLILGLGGVAASIGSLRLFVDPTEFEVRQRAALTEIDHILRERG
jgi:hypothetical protein